MVTDNHYRWDFIGLSTDTKPTPATSEKVVDGSTYYCSDTSKLYVYCNENWYERKPLGGGGSSYTAGTGIDITDSTISVDTEVIQPLLTAGDNITITDNVISASGGSGGVTILTADNYDFPVDTPNGVALWKLPTGLYVNGSGGNMYLYYGTGAGKLTSVPNGASFMVLSRDTAGTSSFVYSYDGSFNIPNYIVAKSSGVAKKSGILTQDHLRDDLIASVSGVDALDAYQGHVLNEKINGLIVSDASAPTTATAGVLGQLYTDTTNMHTYQLTAIDTTDPDNPSYTWTQRW